MSSRVLTLSMSQLISPYGPGALVDILGESFVAMSADRWPKRTLLPEIDCQRLSSRLHVQHFYGPPQVTEPESSNALGINLARFPAWLFCQNCRRMIRWTAKDEHGATPECPYDQGRLVPMRFIATCKENSHAFDIPWPDWMHGAEGYSGDCKEKTTLRFKPVEGGSQGLGGLKVSCDACGTYRTLGDLQGNLLKRDGIRCRAIQPWESTWGDCDSPLEVIQRGATSFHYSDVQSAIDIPAVGSSVQAMDDKIRDHALFLGLRDSIDGPHAEPLAMMIAEGLGLDIDEILANVRESLTATSSDALGSILTEEFQAFRAAEYDGADEANFKTRAVTLSQESDDPLERALGAIFESIILVDRLREVRASIGFMRYKPDSALIPAVDRAQDDASWLPAVEGFGEGVFLRVNQKLLDDWAKHSAIVDRAAELERKFDSSNVSHRLNDGNFSIQYVALHSISHSLLTEFSFTSGYSAASLRERIYCDTKGDYGIFIYTTSSDEEGTLGGLVREGEHDRIGTVLARAIEQLSWCANDPVCAESQPQNLDGLNLAACHSCLLASETSCSGFNLLLDRVLLTGSDDIPGLLHNVLKLVHSA